MPKSLIIITGTETVNDMAAKSMNFSGQGDLFRPSAGRAALRRNAIDWDRFALEPEREIRMLPRNAYSLSAALEHIGSAVGIYGYQFNYRRAVNEASALAKCLKPTELQQGLEVRGATERLAALDVCAQLPQSIVALDFVRHALFAGTPEMEKSAARALIGMFFSHPDTAERLEKMSMEVKGAVWDLDARRDALFEISKELFRKFLDRVEGPSPENAAGYGTIVTADAVFEKTMSVAGREFSGTFHVLVDQTFRNRWIY